jgi:hypothetical protein
MVRYARCRFALLAVFVFIFAGCKSSSRGEDGDAALTIDLGVPVADRGSRPPPPPSFSLTPTKIVHLSSGWPTDTAISLRGQRWRMTLAEATKQLEASFSLVRLPTMTAVAGAWTHRQLGDNASASEHLFGPSASLVAGEYAIRFTPTSTLVAEPTTRFTVGSLPRVIEVQFLSTTGKGAVDALTLRFSEKVKAASVAQGLAVRRDGSTTAEVMTLLSQGSDADVVAVQASTTFDPNVVVHLTLDSDVGLPVKLDSNYQGKESPQPFTLSIQPKDCSPTSPWRPAL